MRLQSTFLSVALTTLTIASACTGDIVARDSENRLSIDEYQASLMLELVNAPTSDLAFLDDDVELNARAAQNIVAVRNGTDGVYPSEDDFPFVTLEELDAVPYVGDAALQTLLDYVIANPPPAGELVEGVEFTGTEAVAVVWGVNKASVAELDDDVGLDARAAQNLVASAPYDSVAEMGPVAYVGAAALKKLRDHALIWAAEKADDNGDSPAGKYDGVYFDEPTAIIALEIANDSATAALTAAGGIYANVATTIVENRPYADLGELAGTYGIGKGTMQSLHDFASSGMWPDDVPCDAVFEPAVEPLVEAYADGTWAFDDSADYTKYNIKAYSVPTCATLDDPHTVAAVRKLLIEHSSWEYVLEGWPDLLEYGNVFSSSTAFNTMLDSSLTRMDDIRLDKINDGDENAQAEFDALAELHGQVTELVTTNDTSSLHIHFEAIECSQDAAIVVDLTAGLVVAIQKGPAC